MKAAVNRLPVRSATSRSNRDLLPDQGRFGAGDDEAFPTVDTAIAPTGGQDHGAPRRVLGRYLLLERLGSGGFGEVFRAQDELLRRQVAVKRVPCESDGVGERAAREAHAAARLSHPAIVALYEATEQDGWFYLTSELVEGQTLARLIAQDALDDEQIVEIGRALCDALRHAHSRGVIHRDVKPQNILVPDEPADRSGIAKLTDFGGARLAGEEALTATGDVLGTLAYMAPEQSEGQEAGPEADLYSLALVLYEALSGENPVRAATPAATVRRIGSDLPSLRRLRRDLPRELTDAVDRALLADPDRRGGLGELAQALALVPTDPQRHDWDEEGGEEESDDDPVGNAWTSIGPQLRERERVSVPVETLRRPASIRRASGRAPAPAPPQEQPQQGGLPAAPAAARRKLWLPALPRLAWTVAVLVLLGWQLGAGRSGLALLLAAGALPLLLAMPRRASVAWLAGALAPLLGLAGLAAAFPALASFPSSARTRAWLGALGYWWLCLAEVGLGRGLAPALSFSAGFPSANAGAAWRRPGWESSISSAAHAIGPLLSPAMLAGAAVWALGAVLAPMLVRGAGVALDAPLAGLWTAAMLAGPGLLAGILMSGAADPAPPASAIVGALLGALLLLAGALSGDPPYRGYAAEPPHA
jgi:eukaryotic-like serine/threonine-protein kinase